MSESQQSKITFTLSREVMYIVQSLGEDDGHYWYETNCCNDGHTSLLVTTTPYQPSPCGSVPGPPQAPSEQILPQIDWRIAGSGMEWGRFQASANVGFPRKPPESTRIPEGVTWTPLFHGVKLQIPDSSLNNKVFRLTRVTFVPTGTAKEIEVYLAHMCGLEAANEKFSTFVSQFHPSIRMGTSQMGMISVIELDIRTSPTTVYRYFPVYVLERS